MLGDFLLLPEDDLSFAAMLVSPLGGLDHGDLEDLAVRRDGALFQALRARAGERAHWRAAWERFAALAVPFCLREDRLPFGVTLIGDEPALRAEMARRGTPPARLHVRHAPDVVEMGDKAAREIRRARETSMYVGAEMVKAGEADAFVTIGNTGAGPLHGQTAAYLGSAHEPFFLNSDPASPPTTVPGFTEGSGNRPEAP